MVLLMDSIFIGATLGKDMRNTMFVALLSLSVWWACQSLGNHALWLAVLFFMALRGGLLGAVFFYRWRKDVFASC